MAATRTTMSIRLLATVIIAIAADAVYSQRTVAVIPDTIPAINVDVQLQHGAVYCANLQCPPQTDHCVVHARSDSARIEQIVTTTRCFAAAAAAADTAETSSTSTSGGAVLRERTVRTLVEATADTTLAPVDMYTMWALGSPPVPSAHTSEHHNNCPDWTSNDDGDVDAFDEWLGWLFD